MWGIVPAAGRGSRIQPLAFSKELLPVGSRSEGGGERPCAVSEYLLERLVLGGVDRICFVIAPGKSDIMEYFGASYRSRPIAYVLQPRPSGLCDAVFRAQAVVGRDEAVAVGLPDTIWFPETALAQLPLFSTASVGYVKSRSSRRIPNRSGFGAPSRCQARCSVNCATCGSPATAGTNISAPW